MLEAADGHSKVIFISSPNNPTANRFDDAAIAKLLENFRGLVVIDEAYVDFSKAGSWIRNLEKYPNLIVTQTFSKALGMAGIRLGIAYASQEIVDILNKIKPPYNVNALTQIRAMEQLENTDQNASELRQILEEREKLMKALPGIPCIEQVFDSDANFILARVDDAQKRYDALINMGIVVRNRSKQPLCENTLRFTVGTAEENVTLIQALKEL
jgi:histidinol-phosphate aminotransferase